ncbi:hypothetical protein LX36DRAFT_460315 [Colletotrichum falcatum]|nr:hypothetical protein LX36DRAFT_460315 [Colletotrichum falcatum]
MKISILTAILYSVVSVNASCWCLRGKFPHNGMTETTCRAAGHKVISDEGDKVCSIPNVDHHQWNALYIGLQAKWGNFRILQLKLLKGLRPLTV